MIQMKEKIIEVLRESPRGLRLREIASHLRCNQFSLISPMYEMEQAGVVSSRSNEDHANGEYYTIWFLAK